MGAQAAGLGLSGEVSAAALELLLSGCDPTNGEVLGYPLLKSDVAPKAGSGLRSRVYGVAPPNIRKLSAPTARRFLMCRTILAEVGEYCPCFNVFTAHIRWFTWLSNSAVNATAVGSS